MNDKTIKAMAKFAMTFENETKKLYDKQKSLKLSHNRKCQLLQTIKNKIKFIKQNYCYSCESLDLELNNIMEKIENELTFNGRKNWGLK